MAKGQSDAELQACHVLPLPEGRERNESTCRPDIKRAPYQERQYSLPEPSPQACCLVVRPPVPHQKEWTAPIELPSQVWFGRGLAHRWPNNMDSVSVSVRELHNTSKLRGNDASLWNWVLWLEGPTHPSSSPRSISVGDTKGTLHHQNTPKDRQMLSKPQRWAAEVDHHYYQFGSVAVQHRVEPRDCIG